MRKRFNYFILFAILLSTLFSTSSIRSLAFPGWGEMNEFKILSKESDLESIKYIEKRSNAMMLTEGSLWISFLITNELSSSYENDYKTYARNNAGVNWTDIPESQISKYAANVGNEMSFIEYNDIRSQVGLSTYPENQGYEWDWGNDSSKRLKYDKIRNKSEQFSKFNNYIVASFLINRIISAFDVLSIKKNHGRMVSFDINKENNSYNYSLNFHF